MDIVTKEESQLAADDKVTANRLCFFCGKSPASYTCPRCESVYCGLDCYKSERHADCSETFYKESFMRELKEKNHVDEEEKCRIMEMIERTYDENPLFDIHEDAEDDLAARLEGLDIENLEEGDVDEVLKRLTDAERDEFHKMIETGQIFDVYNKQTGVKQEWEPYWHKHSNGLVKPMTPGKVEETNPPLSNSNVVKNASPNVLFNLVNILYPYACFQSIYNGVGHKDFPLEFTDCVISCSVFLSSNKVLNSAEEALVECLIKCRNCCKERDIATSEKFLLECIRSVSHILIGPDPDDSTFYVNKALKQLHTACTRTRHLLKKEAAVGGKEDVSIKRKLLFGITKKIDYLLIWAANNKDQLALLSMEVVEIFKCRITRYENSQLADRNVNKTKITKVTEATPPKIMELD